MITVVSAFQGRTRFEYYIGLYKNTEMEVVKEIFQFFKEHHVMMANDKVDRSTRESALSQHLARVLNSTSSFAPDKGKLVLELTTRPSVRIL